MPASRAALAVECTQTIRWPSAEGSGAGKVEYTWSGSPRRAPGSRSASVHCGGWVWIQSRNQRSSDAGAGQHGDEPAAGGGDVAHRLARAQLGVCDVEEVGAAQQRHQPVPGRDVGGVVGGVAVGEPVGDGHRPVGGHGQDPHQLLEVGAVVLGVPESDLRGGFAPARGPVGVPVDPGHGDRGGVVVQFGGVDVELGDHPEDQLGEQAGPVGVEQPLQCPAHPVVVDLPAYSRRRRVRAPAWPARSGPPTHPARRAARARPAGCAPPARSRWPGRVGSGRPGPVGSAPAGPAPGPGPGSG